MEELDFFTDDEIDYIIQNFEVLTFYSMCKSLRTKILFRTGKCFSDSAIIKEIRKINPERKRYILEKEERNKEKELSEERIKKLNINGYKPVKFYKNIVLFEKEVNGNTFRTCYKYTELRCI